MTSITSTEPTTTAICTCSTTAEYRCLDRDCPEHGDEREHLRRHGNQTTITPCPVAWCDEAGHHLYDAEACAEFVAQQGGDPGDRPYSWHTRTCRHETGPVVVAAPDQVQVEIGAEVYENDEGKLIGPYVNLGNGGDLYLHSTAELGAVITALTEAGRIAFTTEFTSNESVAGDYSRKMAAAILTAMVAGDWTISDLAKLAEVDTQTLIQRLSGQFEFTVNEIGRIADALECPPSSLFGSADAAATKA